MRRRGLLAALASLTVAGCSDREGGSAPAASSAPHATPIAPGPSPASLAPAPLAAEFAWFIEDPTFMGLGFCLTWVRGLAPAEVARRMGARARGTYAWDSLPAPGEDEALLAITDTGRWSLMIEYNGITAIDKELIRTLSAGTRLVANYRNVENDGSFVVADDGIVVAEFDPATPDAISGSAPQQIRAAMAGLGMDDMSRGDYTEAALVLTGRLTGVPLTEQLVHGSTYLAATMPDPLR